MATYTDLIYDPYSYNVPGATMQVGDYEYILTTTPGSFEWYKTSSQIPLTSGTNIVLNIASATTSTGVVAPIGAIRVRGQTASGMSVPYNWIRLNLLDNETSKQGDFATVEYDSEYNTVSITLSDSLSWIEVEMGASNIGRTDGCVVRCATIDKTKTHYNTPLSKIPHRGLSVNDMTYCFRDCTSLLIAPPIPDSVTHMYSCFYNCVSLIQAPVIPSKVISMYFCFRGCTSLTGDIYIFSNVSTTNVCFENTTQPITLYPMSDNADACTRLAQTANNGNVSVNIQSETPKTFTDTQMNYMTGAGLKPLSLQTDATLVQCEVPDLVNGGTIVTNVNDALIDLYSRKWAGGGA